MQKDIFFTLSRYSVAAEENYLTEAFVFLLRLVLERQPNSGLDLLNRLCGLPADALFSDSSAITVRTQQTLTVGRPDIEIRENDRVVVYVEVKHDSPIGEGQLEAYYAALQSQMVQTTNLVLLTRSRFTYTSLPRDRFHHVCWYDVADWLSRINVQDEVSQFLIGEFLSFLYGKRMAMKKVNWQYIEGIPALFNLVYMLETAISEAYPDAKKVRRTAGWSWRGFYLDNGLWCGIRYETPLKVMLENNNGNYPTYRQELDLQQVHFFSLNEGEQFEVLVDFVRKAIASALSQSTTNEIEQ